MAFSIEGFGTKYLGKYDKEPDGVHTHITWIVFFWLPIWPLKATRVKKISEELSLERTRTQFEEYGPGRFSWASVILHYLVTAIAIVVIFFAYLINQIVASYPTTIH